MTSLSASRAILDSVLDTPTGLESGAAAKVAKHHYDVLVSHGNLSSYSMDQVYHDCPRKWEMKKLQAAIGASARISSPTFAFGHAVGAGVATYDKLMGEDATKNEALRAATFQAFLAWDIDLLEEEIKGSRKTGKSFHEAVWALYNYAEFHESETDLAAYETVHIEATLAVDFEDGHYYVGHIDELLRNRQTGVYRVKENKTTGLSTVDPALYANSDQALSYAIVVDMLGGTEFEVLYTIYSSTKQEWVQYSFAKNALRKAEWIQDQLLTNQQRDRYTALNFFPKRGGACMSFMRRCEFFDTCTMSNKSMYGVELADLPRISCFADLAQIEKIDFATTLTDIVGKQMEKIANAR